MRYRESGRVLPGELVPDYGRIGPEFDEGNALKSVPGRLF